MNHLHGGRVAGWVVKSDYNTTRPDLWVSHLGPSVAKYQIADTRQYKTFLENRAVLFVKGIWPVSSNA